MNSQENGKAGPPGKHDMRMVQPRSRPVSFRLTPEEYHEVERIYARSGARSISDFARAAVMLWVANNNAAVSPEQRAVVEIRSNEMNALRELQAWICRIFTPRDSDQARVEPGNTGAVKE